MKENYKSSSFRNILACCLMFSVFVASSTVAWAMPENNKSAGELVISGHSTNGDTPFAMLNGEKAFSGRTFFSASTIATTAESVATLKLGKLGSVTLSPNSILSLNFGDNKITGSLIAGQAKVFSSDGIEVNIQAAGKTFSNTANSNDALMIDAQTGAALADNAIVSPNLYGDAGALPAQTTTQTTTGNNSYVGPLIIFGAVVAVAAIYVITHRNNDSVTVLSTVR